MKMTKKDRKARLKIIASMHLSKEGQKALDDCAEHGDVRCFFDYLFEKNGKTSNYIIFEASEK